MSNCYQIDDFGFSKKNIEKAIGKNGLLSMEIEFSLFCNFKCAYCYVPTVSYFENELKVDEIYDIISQAKELGAKRIIILGGEPSIYQDTLNIIKYIKKLDIEVEIFTNGSGITSDFANQLYANNVRVVLKMNSFDCAVQDKLAGKKGAYEIIQSAFNNLCFAGYPSRDAFMAVSTIICKQNIDELSYMWKWLRDRNIAPYFEMITPQENAKKNEWLYVSHEEIKRLFIKLADMDKSLYDKNWNPQPPLAGNRCLRHQFSCVITSKGNVMPCVGVNISVGNIREEKLKNIIKNSDVIQNLRDYPNTIKGKCHSCEKSDNCYGCRGAAYQLTGDYLASDPTCWHKNQSVINL